MWDNDSIALLMVGVIVVVGLVLGWLFDRNK